MNNDILVIGEALIDVVRRPGDEPQCLPGGCAMNVAVGLGRLGYHPVLATWFADDEYGRIITDHCAESGVRFLAGSDQAKHTTTADAAIDDEGKATYTFDIEWQLPPIPEDLRPGLVHTGSLGALVQPGGRDVLAYIENIRQQAFVAFDPNCRPAIMGDPAQARAVIERYVAASDLVKVSDEDLAWLYPATTKAQLLDQAHAWAATGPAVVVVTLGQHGSLAITRTHKEVRVPANTTGPLADTVGAGDSFMAGLIHGLAQSDYDFAEAKTRFGQDLAELTAILAQAATIAGITVSRAGANPPWAYELP